MRRKGKEKGDQMQGERKRQNLSSQRPTATNGNKEERGCEATENTGPDPRGRGNDVEPPESRG